MMALANTLNSGQIINANNTISKTILTRLVFQLILFITI